MNLLVRKMHANRLICEVILGVNNSFIKIQTKQDVRTYYQNDLEREKNLENASVLVNNYCVNCQLENNIDDNSCQIVYCIARISVDDH